MTWMWDIVDGSLVVWSPSKDPETEPGETVVGGYDGSFEDHPQELIDHVAENDLMAAVKEDFKRV